MLLGTCVILSLFISSIRGVDVDYYSSVLRSTSKCKSYISQLLCQIRCNMRPAVCTQDICYCKSVVPEKEKNPEAGRSRIENEKSKVIELKEETVDYDDLSPEVTQIGILPPYAYRPTLRHHIAHFCPNLDIARDCIRTCMAQGKPAFCGKDHVCYCGHKYPDTVKESKVDVKSIYAQFKDLYEKYFGPGYVEEMIELSA